MKRAKADIIREQEQEIKSLREALYTCLQYSAHPCGVTDKEGKFRLDSIALKSWTTSLGGVSLQQIVEIAVFYPVWCELRNSEEWKGLVAYLRRYAKQSNLPVRIEPEYLAGIQENHPAVPIRRVIGENHEPGHLQRGKGP